MTHADKLRRALRAQCVRTARECSRSSWQHPEDRAEFLRLKREAMNDARAWRLKP